jgi:N-acetylmuramoyl-L-alanine amidase
MLLRPYQFFIIPAALLLLAPALARADFPHTVGPGESLTSVAATDGLTVDQLAAANGLSPNAELVTGSTLMIPPQGGGGTSSPSGGGSGSSGGSAGDGDSDSDDDGGGGSSGGAPAGSYVVQPGDTLWAIAHRDETTVRELAAQNGLNPNGVLLSGTVLQFGGGSTQSGGSGGSSSGASTSQPVGSAAEGSSGGPPYPTPETVSPSEVGQIAAANDVPPSLAKAIADQESGFNNNVVSPADAIGVMQILPGTWNWIGQTLAGPMPLDPNSAAGNIRAGVLLLHSLLGATGGNVGLTAAGYYQGLPSVRARGLYSDTQQYVANVEALQHRFGGP